MIWAKLIGLGLLIAALMYGVHVVLETFREQGRAEIRPQVVAAEKRATDAESANKELAASIEGVRGQCKAAAAEFEKQHELDTAAQARTRKELDALKSKRAADAATIAALDKRAATPSTGTRAQVCDQAEKILDDLAKAAL